MALIDPHQDQYDDWRRSKVEELLNLGFTPQQIHEKTRIVRPKIARYIAEITEERTKKAALTATDLKSNHIYTSQTLKHVAVIGMMHARKSADDVVPKEEVVGDDGTKYTRSKPMTGAEAEAFARLETVAIRWAVVALKCEEFEAKVDASLIESDGSNNIRLPAGLLKTHELHLKILARMPKKDLAAVADIFRRAERTDEGSILALSAGPNGKNGDNGVNHE